MCITLKLCLAFCLKWIYVFYLLNYKHGLIMASIIIIFSKMTTCTDMHDSEFQFQVFGVNRCLRSYVINFQSCLRSQTPFSKYFSCKSQSERLNFL